MIYAIGDIHGMFHKLVALYGKILNDISSHGLQHATIIFLGDYVDRGPDSDRVLDYLMQLEDTDVIRHIFLKGNHEDMMVNVYYRKGLAKMWIDNGGRQTLDSFGCPTPIDFYENPRFRDYIVWCETLPVIHVMDRYAFVHGGYDTRLTAGNQNPDTLMWKRSTPYTLGREYDNCEFVIVHGHTPHPEPLIYKNEINIDTFACYDGKLTAACLPEDIGKYTSGEINDMSEQQVHSIIDKKVRFLTS